MPALLAIPVLAHGAEVAADAIVALLRVTASLVLLQIVSQAESDRRCGCTYLHAVVVASVAGARSARWALRSDEGSADEAKDDCSELHFAGVFDDVRVCDMLKCWLSLLWKPMLLGSILLMCGR